MTPEKAKSDQDRHTSAVLRVGDRAPAFTLKSNTGERVRLGQFKDQRNVVVYFYPRDDTPGCTREACAFRDAIFRFEGGDTVVLGISSDDLASHQKFAVKYTLPFRLLVDQDAAVAKKYGVWVEKNLYGRKSYGIERSTFLVDKQGRLAAVWSRVQVDGHVEQVLAALEKVAASATGAAPQQRS